MSTDDAERFYWVIEGDVKACFDEISHKAILGVLREKVMDNKFLDLIRRFLKAGVSFRGALFSPTEKGVPQGGVASHQLLANVVLNKLDWFLHGKGKVTTVKQQIASRQSKASQYSFRTLRRRLVRIHHAGLQKRYAERPAGKDSRSSSRPNIAVSRIVRWKRHACHTRPGRLRISRLPVDNSGDRPKREVRIPKISIGPGKH